MTIKDGKIIACTDEELYAYWLKQFADVISYPEYKLRMIYDCGVEVEEKNAD